MPDARPGRPIYLSGANNPALRQLEAEGYDVGLLITPDTYPGAIAETFRVWAADNACFNQGDKFDAGEWLCWFGTLPRPRIRFGNHHGAYESRLLEPNHGPLEAVGCLYVNAPDVVGDAEGTWQRSEPFLDVIRSLGFPVGVVAQDGAEEHVALWDEDERWDVLFIGGSTEWKESRWAALCAREARVRGKWVHVGRVNSWRRMDLVRSWADSVDGTFLAFGPDTNAARLRRWLDKLDREPTMLAV